MSNRVIKYSVQAYAKLTAQNTPMNRTPITTPPLPRTLREINHFRGHVQAGRRCPNARRPRCDLAATQQKRNPTSPDTLQRGQERQELERKKIDRYNA
jgi:hypothetical protein